MKFRPGIVAGLAKRSFEKTNFYNGLLIFTIVTDDWEEFLSVSWMLVKNYHWCNGCLGRILQVPWMIAKNSHRCLRCLWRIVIGVLDDFEEFFYDVMNVNEELSPASWMLENNAHCCHGYLSRILTGVMDGFEKNYH